ncbi:hypothetical protein AGENTSMITH_50 [Bacillus phage vB_BspM_AgentSmith]|nr:hypothetical protein AGENTSMITH_50 [Bacillus phage vB_BspM_AgentSmith]
MKVPILGISPNINITTDKGVVEVRNLACAIEVGVKVKPITPYKLKNSSGEWVNVVSVTNLGTQYVRDFIVEDGRCFVVGDNQRVLTNKGLLSGDNIKTDIEITLQAEGDIDYPPVEWVEGFPSFPLDTNSLSTLKLLGMITAFGRVIPELGVIGLEDVQSRTVVDFTNLMETVFHLAPEDMVKTKQTTNKVSVHYTHVGLARWLNGLLNRGIPCEVMRASKEQILMFLKGMYDQRYSQTQTPIKGAKYVYYGNKPVVARQVFSLLKVLGYSPRLLNEQDHKYSVLTTGVNIHEDSKLRSNLYKDVTTKTVRVKEVCGYLDEVYLIEIDQGNNYIADGLVINTGVI